MYHQHYSRYDLRVTLTEEGDERVVSARAPGASAHAPLPSLAMLWWRTRRGRSDLDIGSALFSTLFGSRAMQELYGNWWAGRASYSLPRLVLRIEAPALLPIRWELIQVRQEALSLADELLVVRLAARSPAVAKQLIQPPLRVVQL